MNAWSASHKGAKVEARVHPGGGVAITATGNSRQAIQQALAEAEVVRDAALSTYLACSAPSVVLPTLRRSPSDLVIGGCAVGQDPCARAVIPRDDADTEASLIECEEDRLARRRMTVIEEPRERHDGVQSPASVGEAAVHGRGDPVPNLRGSTVYNPDRELDVAIFAGRDA